MNGDLYYAHLRASPVKTLEIVGKRTGNYGKQMGVFSQWPTAFCFRILSEPWAIYRFARSRERDGCSSAGGEFAGQRCADK